VGNINLSTLLAANTGTFLSSTAITATAGQVKFPAVYTVGFVEVFQNGLRLSSSDFTAANGEHVMLDSGASVGDAVDIVAHKATSLSGYTSDITIIAGTGLTGGGTLAANRTLTLDVASSPAAIALIALANTNTYIAATAATAATKTTVAQAALANTNAAIATKSSLAQLANTNSFTVRTTGAHQTMAPSLTVSNTIIVLHGVPVRTTGGNNVTLALGDNGKLIYCVNTASAMNIHIPNNSSVAFPVGAEMSFLQHLTHASANTLGFSNAAGVILHSKLDANTVADRFATAVLKKLATNTWILAGSLS
jgi:hypothetical protein